MRRLRLVACVLGFALASPTAVAQQEKPERDEAPDDRERDSGEEPAAGKGESPEDGSREGDEEGEGGGEPEPGSEQPDRGEKKAEGEDGAGAQDEESGAAEGQAPGEGSEPPQQGKKGQQAPGQEPQLERPQLRQPRVQPLEMPGGAAPQTKPGKGEQAPGGAAEAAEGEQPAPGKPKPEQAEPAETEKAADEDEEAEAGSPSSDFTKAKWVAPETTLSLHGYYRLRWNVQDTFFLGRDLANDPDLPFGRFKPAHRSAVPRGGCGGDPEADEACGTADQLRHANMRLRLRPSIALSDHLKVHMMVDVFDNLVLGSTPEGTTYNPPGGNLTGDPPQGFVRSARAPNVSIDSFSNTQNPPSGLRNSLQDSIRVRRAWAEVGHPGIGQLRFGRMGSHWGLGIFHNAGEGIDSDFQTDVDRIMGVTKLGGFHLAAMYDFASEGFIFDRPTSETDIPFDASQADDTRQAVFAAARRTDQEKQEQLLRQGDWVLNGGLFFVYRKQFLSAAGIEDPFNPNPNGIQFVRRNMQTFTPDVWLEFRWENLRVELESMFRYGNIRNIRERDFEDGDFQILQGGYALESEYRLLQDKLGIYFYTGYASGDEDVDGLSPRSQGGLVTQASPDDRISALGFHPNYRIDLILWRNIMGQFSSAYYVKPGISYDVLRNDFGRRLGARVDMIYSRAANEVQTPGADRNLGVELDATAYYRSEEGPALTDGFFGQVQFGVLFPFAGLGFPNFRGTPAVPGGNPGVNNAWTIRILLGVEY